MPSDNTVSAAMKYPIPGGGSVSSANPAAATSRPIARTRGLPIRAASVAAIAIPTGITANVGSDHSADPSGLIPSTTCRYYR